MMKCSFCGTEKNEAKTLMTAQSPKFCKDCTGNECKCNAYNAFICDKCVTSLFHGLEKNSPGEVKIWESTRLKEDSDDIFCSFCGTSSKKVKSLVTAIDHGFCDCEDDCDCDYRSVFICDLCVRSCVQILEKQVFVDEKVEKKPKYLDIKSPKDIYDKLEKKIEGQQKAKEALSVFGFLHCMKHGLIEKKFHDESVKKTYEDIKLEKINLLLIGPTGSGKTYLVKTLAEILEVPFIIQDVTSITGVGYVGQDIEVVMERAIKVANGDIQLAQKAIFVLDEIDKIAKRSDTSGSRDISGEDVQHGALKILEDSEVAVSYTDNYGKKSSVGFKTGGLMVVCVGAFEHLGNIISKRLNKNPLLQKNPEDNIVYARFSKNPDIEKEKEKSSLFGQATEKKFLLNHVSPADLVSYGFINEFVGRIHLICVLDELTSKSLMSILTTKENSVLEQYKKMFQWNGISLNFAQDALEELVDVSLSTKTGARALKSTMSNVLVGPMFQLFGENDVESFDLDSSAVLKALRPKKKRIEEPGTLQKTENNLIKNV